MRKGQRDAKLADAKQPEGGGEPHLGGLFAAAERLLSASSLVFSFFSFSSSSSFPLPFSSFSSSPALLLSSSISSTGRSSASFSFSSAVGDGFLAGACFCNSPHRGVGERYVNQHKTAQLATLAGVQA